MKDEANIGVMLAVAGLFALTFYLLRTNREPSAVVAASCAGLTGATLSACQKAQPKPKPKPAGITAAKPKPKPQGITAARPRGITAARPSASTPSSRARSTGGGVGGPTVKALECKQSGGIWRAYAASGGTLYRCLRPITASSRNVLGYNNCIKNAKLYTDRKKKLGMDAIALQYGYQGLNPGQQLMDNNAQTPSAGYQVKLIRNKYDYLFKDLVRECEKKYLDLDIIGQQNRGAVPRAPFEPGAGGIANTKADLDKQLGPGEFPT
jgi:hypothetical protein